MSEQELMGTEEELDFSQDTTVETIEGIWTITDVGEEVLESEKGSGKRLVIEFTGDALPFPITVRQFLSYQYKNGDSTVKNGRDWVKASRGVLKNIAKAATGDVRTTMRGLLGRQVRATTKDDGNGFYTLYKFRPASNGSL